MIVACVCLYDERVEEAIPTIKLLRPNVDRYVAIVDESVSAKQKKTLKKFGCEVHVHPWEDDLVKLRNQMLNECKLEDWVIVHDPDEFFNEPFCRDLRKICGEADKKGVDILLINVHDITYQSDGTKTEEVSWFFKPLIIKKKKGISYYAHGETEGGIHEALRTPSKTKMMKLPKKYWYEHVKKWHEILERAGRNTFIGGGGENVKMSNPSWKSLREICISLGLGNWPEAREYFRKGNIDDRLKEWLWQNRKEGYDWQNEMVQFGRWYFEYLHPEERQLAKDKVWKSVPWQDGSEPEVMKYVEKCYETILARGPDPEGKEHYTKAILTNQIKREDLPEILKNSQEYKEKFQQNGEKR